MRDFFYESLRISFACFVLLALLQPFGIDQLQEWRIPFIFGQTVCVFVSIFVVNYLLSKVSLGLSITFDNQKGIWEIIRGLAIAYLLVNFVIAALLLTYDCWFMFGNPLTGWFDNGVFTLKYYMEIFWQSLFVSIILFVWNVYHIRNSQLKDELSELKALNKLLEERQEAEKETPADTQEEPKRCIIESGSNNVSLDVNPKDILYIESMSNYADICYLENGATRHITMRITLKQLRETLSDFTYLVSCHRAFIVNLNFIISIATRPSGGYQLQVFGTEKEIPVSRTYTEEIKKRMSTT